MKNKFLPNTPALSLMLGLSLPLAAVADVSRENATGNRVVGIGVDCSGRVAEFGKPGVANGCRVLSTIEGSSGYGKKPNWKSVATVSALRQVEQIGATHIVWERFATVGVFNGRAVASAYTC